MAVGRVGAHHAAVVAQQCAVHVAGPLEVLAEDPRAVADVGFDVIRSSEAQSNSPAWKVHHLHQADRALAADRAGSSCEFSVISTP